MKMMRIAGPGLWTFALLIGIPLSAQSSLTLSSNRVMPATHVTLSWRTSSGGSVFIFPLGVRPGTGSERIRADSSLTFVLYHHSGGDRIETDTATLIVEGSTRSGGVLDLPFTGVRRYEVSAPSFAHLIGQITRLMQDHMGYSIPNARPDRPVIETPLLERPDLIAPAERETIGRRWLAYSIEVAPGQAGRFVCWVSTAIRYKRVLEQRVRDQPEGDLHRRAADEFVQRLLAQGGNR
jgi:hypothetical protein